MENPLEPTCPHGHRTTLSCSPSKSFEVRQAAITKPMPSSSPDNSSLCSLLHRPDPETDPSAPLWQPQCPRRSCWGEGCPRGQRARCQHRGDRDAANCDKPLVDLPALAADLFPWASALKATPNEVAQ